MVVSFWQQRELRASVLRSWEPRGVSRCLPKRAESRSNRRLHRQLLAFQSRIRPGWQVESKRGYRPTELSAGSHDGRESESRALADLSSLSNFNTCRKPSSAILNWVPIRCLLGLSLGDSSNLQALFLVRFSYGYAFSRGYSWRTKKACNKEVTMILQFTTS